jgi:hypothetical protein
MHAVQNIDIAITIVFSARRQRLAMEKFPPLLRGALESPTVKYHPSLSVARTNNAAAFERGRMWHRNGMGYLRSISR